MFQHALREAHPRLYQLKQTLPCPIDPKEARCRCTPNVWKPTPQHPTLARTRNRLIITVNLFGRANQFQYGGQLFDVGVDRSPEATTQLATKFLHVPRTAIEYKYAHDEIAYRQLWSIGNAWMGDCPTPQVTDGTDQTMAAIANVRGLNNACGHQATRERTEYAALKL